MVTKMVDKYKLKIDILSFLAKFKAIGDRFFKNWLSAQATTKNILVCCVTC